MNERMFLKNRLICHKSFLYDKTQFSSEFSIILYNIDTNILLQKKNMPNKPH